MLFFILDPLGFFEAPGEDGTKSCCWKADTSTPSDINDTAEHISNSRVFRLV